MNPNQPSREQIEARLTALLLGELPAEEAELLRWTISQDSELQRLHSRLLLTVGLVREVVAQPAETSAEKAAPRQLSEERRQKLLNYFKLPRPKPAAKELPWLKRIEIRPLVTALALVAIVGVLAAMMLPYSLWFLVTWTVFLIIYYAIGLPLGLGASYEYVMPQ